MDNWNILVVEDDPDAQEVVERLLRIHKIVYDTVSTAEEAWNALREKSYTAAIIDLHLPGRDGWSLFHQIQADEDLDVACVAITAFHSAEVAHKAVEDGFRAYFSKPLIANSFIGQLQTIL